ncbi:MAG: hypothetical protein II170_07555 [Bacteroidaceae bacterium]|nr:hypothetical protein [Bacteroidaceae bacterium]MBQ2519561.1 hypothetical protein [Bacteroidaceae bacterium]
MKASQQTIQQIERSLRKIAAKFPQGDDALLTDIHLLVNPYTGEIRAYNDDDEELDRCVVEEWIKSPEEDFYESVAPILRQTIEGMRPVVDQMNILRPFSFVLIDEDHETLQDLVLIDDEETVVLDGNLLDGLEEDLDAFLEHLLND